MFKKLLVDIIKIYQKTFPITDSISRGLGLVQTSCKYQPTCSNYMIEAINKYGANKGLRLGIKRILKCNPFSEGGYDPA